MFKKIIFILTILLLAAPLASLPMAAAAPVSGMVSINFDDGLLSTYTLAAPLMKEYGFKGTAYIYTQPQNEQEPGYYDEFMSWDQVVSLQNDFGWEIGSHGYTHNNLTQMTLEQARLELDRSKADLINHNINVKSFASPYGSVNESILNYVTTIFDSHRSAWNLANTLPLDKYYLKAMSVSPTTPVSQVKLWIDQAKQNKEWLIIYFHALTTGQSAPANYDYNVGDFEQILDYIKTSNLPVMTNTAGVASYPSLSTPAENSNPNLIANGDFEDNTNFNPAYLTWYSTMNDQDSLINPFWGYPAEIVGEVEFVAGRNGHAASLTDLSWSPDYVALPAYQVIDPKQGAIVFWYQPNYDHTENTEARFFEADADWCDCEFEFNHDPAGSLYFKIEALKNNAIIVPASDYSWRKGDWVKLEVRWRESDFMAVYVNDQQVGFLGRDENNQIHGHLPDFTNHYLGSVLTIGSAGSQGKINGVLDDFMIFKSSDYQLPDDQASADFWIRNPKTEVKITNASSGRTAQIVGSQSKNSLSSYGIPVQAGQAYELKAWFQVSDYQAGDASVWLAEFDKNYGYLGGQWLAGFNANYLGERIFNYTPSAGTAKVEIYFLTHENADMKLEVDNAALKKNI